MERCTYQGQELEDVGPKDGYRDYPLSASLPPSLLHLLFQFSAMDSHFIPTSPPHFLPASAPAPISWMQLHLTQSFIL